MKNITIPKLSEETKNLVAVPQTMYKAFVEWQKKAKSKSEFTPTKGERKTLTNSRRNLKQGKFVRLNEL